MSRPSFVDIGAALPNRPPRHRGARPSGSLTAEVTGRIRDAIMEGRLALGEALSELKLAGAFNVSRTPVREALTALQLEGLIDIRPQSGSYVFLPSEEEVRELAEFRRVIEVTALRFCFARRRDEALRDMRAAADEMERAWSAEDRLGVARADTSFHRAIAENCANEYLVAAYRLASGRVAALRTHNVMSTEPSRTRAMTEHRAIVAAVAKGDLERAETVLSEHIRQMRFVYRASRGRGARAAM